MSESRTQLIVRAHLEAAHSPMDALFEGSETNPLERSDFARLFSESDIFVLEQWSENALQAQIFTFEHEGQKVVPVFSSVQRIRPFVASRKLNRYRRMKARKLLELIPQNLSVILNPESTHARLFSGQELRALVAGLWSADIAPKARPAHLPPPPTAAARAAAMSPSAGQALRKEATAPVIEKISPPAKASEAMAPAKGGGVSVVRPGRTPQPAAKPQGFPVTLARAVAQQAASQNAIESAFLALLDGPQGPESRIVIGVRSTLEASSQEIDELLGGLALALDPVTDDQRPVELCLVEESAELLSAIEARKAKQIYLKPF